MKSKRPSTRHAFLIAVASLPLFQLTCTADALAQSLALEVTSAASLFVFDAAQIVFSNLLGL